MKKVFTAFAIIFILIIAWAILPADDGFKRASGSITAIQIAAEAIIEGKMNWAQQNVDSIDSRITKIDSNNVTNGSLTSADFRNQAVGANALASTAVTAAAYGAANITVDPNGRITAAASSNASVLPVILNGSAALDFPNTAAGASSDLTITVTGADDGDPVFLGIPNASAGANAVYIARVSAANTVTITLFNNALLAAFNPDEGTFTVVVFDY